LIFFGFEFSSGKIVQKLNNSVIRSSLTNFPVLYSIPFGLVEELNMIFFSFTFNTSECSKCNSVHYRDLSMTCQLNTVCSLRLFINSIRRNDKYDKEKDMRGGLNMRRLHRGAFTQKGSGLITLLCTFAMELLVLKLFCFSKCLIQF